MAEQIAERIVMLGPDEIRAWRQNVPDGHTRHGFTFRRPGGRADPEEPTAPLSDGEFVEGDTAHLRVDPLPGPRGRPLDPREAVQRFMQMCLNWARSHPEFMLDRARVLKATSPLQFSHMTEEQLAAELVQIIEEKAKAGVEQTYHRNGWLEPLDLDRTRSAAPANGARLLLPGQRGREV